MENKVVFACAQHRHYCGCLTSKKHFSCLSCIFDWEFINFCESLEFSFRRFLTVSCNASLCWVICFSFAVLVWFLLVLVGLGIVETCFDTVPLKLEIWLAMFRTYGGVVAEIISFLFTGDEKFFKGRVRDFLSKAMFWEGVFYRNIFWLRDLDTIKGTKVFTRHSNTIKKFPEKWLTFSEKCFCFLESSTVWDFSKLFDGARSGNEKLLEFIKAFAQLKCRLI